MVIFVNLYAIITIPLIVFKLDDDYQHIVNKTFLFILIYIIALIDLCLIFMGMN